MKNILIDKRVVLDTNVLISLLISNNYSSKFAELVNYIFAHNTVLCSKDTIDELFDVINRPKLKKVIKNTSFLENWIKIIVLRSERVLTDTEIQACRDQNDNKFLELAVSGKADFIITGDNDLLELNPFENVEIVTPAEALTLITSSSM